jgi:hypothetical protein
LLEKHLLRCLWRQAARTLTDNARVSREALIYRLDLSQWRAASGGTSFFKMGVSR